VRVIVFVVATSACGRVGFASLATTSDAVGDGSATDGLIGWWKLDEGAGSVAADSSSYGDRGVTVGATWMAGRTPNSFAISLDGVTDHEVDLSDPAVLHITGSMTLAGWAYARGFHATSNNDDLIVGRSNNGANDKGWELKASPDCGGVNFVLEIAGSASYAPERCSNTTPVVGVWYHVAGVYDAAAQTMDIYIDGVLDDGLLLGGNPPSAAHVSAGGVHAEIGNTGPQTMFPVGGPGTWNGLLSDVRVYDRALSAMEIAALAR
jgi:hypothetical protein